MFINIIYAITFMTAIILIGLFVQRGFRLLYFIYRIHFNNSNTTYEGKNIRKYTVQLLKSTVVLAILMAGIFFHFRPMEFQEILNIENQMPVDKIEFRGTNNLIAASDKEVMEIIELLNKYKYRRTFNDYSTGNYEFLILDGKGKSTFIEIWDTGYLRILNNKRYKILTTRRDELFNSLKEFTN